MDIKTPENLVALMQGLALDDKAKLKLNIKLANHTRKTFREQVRAQRDVDGRSYAPRSKRAVKKKKPRKKNMLTGFSRNLKTYATKDTFSVGLVGLEGHIASKHNEGKSVVYTRRINGFFNSKTNLWEGGEKGNKSVYKMPERKFIGWTKPLERQVAQMILEQMKPN